MSTPTTPTTLQYIVWFYNMLSSDAVASVEHVKFPDELNLALE